MLYIASAYQELSKDHPVKGPSMILKDFRTTKIKIQILWKGANIFSNNKWRVISNLIDYLMTENGPLPKLCPVQVNIFATGIEG